MNVVDSSGWIEFFTAGSRADAFATVLKRTSALVVPTMVILEVNRHLLRWRGQEDADVATAAMKEGLVAPLDEGIALEAARLLVELKLPLRTASFWRLRAPSERRCGRWMRILRR